jgi:putative membrane protein
VTTGREELWSAWGGDPLALLAVVLVGALYWRGAVAVWRQVGRGRVVRARNVVSFALGMLCVVLALGSPLEAAAGSLFSAHMAQHVLLTTFAAPLLVLGAPVLPLQQGLPPRLRRRLTRAAPAARVVHRLDAGMGMPLLAVGLHAGVSWLWHVPRFYELALRSDVVHALEHATLLGTALLLWRTIVVSGRRHALGYGTGLLLVFGAALLHGGLGAVLTFSPAVLYPAYAAGAAAWGIDALHDQHAAGVIMWGPAKFVHGVAAVILVIAWLRGVEERSTRRAALRRARLS